MIKLCCFIIHFIYSQILKCFSILQRKGKKKRKKREASFWWGHTLFYWHSGHFQFSLEINGWWLSRFYCCSWCDLHREERKIFFFSFFLKDMINARKQCHIYHLYFRQDISASEITNLPQVTSISKITRCDINQTVDKLKCNEKKLSGNFKSAQGILKCFRVWAGCCVVEILVW